MNKTQEALKMAIAWIEADWKPTNKEAVIQACKEALAQPAQEPVISNEQYLDLLYEYCKLKADNERLRENLDYAYYEVNPHFAKNIKDLLATTPAQSLQAHDNEVIERCAVRGRLAQLENKVVDIEIRALKGEQNAI